MKKMANNSGCTYGKINRNMIENLKETIKTEFEYNNAKLDKIEIRQTELFNHQSSRLPLWVTLALTSASGLIVGLIVKLI